MWDMKQLGPLEMLVMKVLWRAPDTALRVGEVRGMLGLQPPRAYTTVMTVLANLYRKG